MGNTDNRTRGRSRIPHSKQGKKPRMAKHGSAWHGECRRYERNYDIYGLSILVYRV